MKPKIEVYFVIYLASIVSFFAVESEVKRYKRDQDNILLQASQDQINSIIEINESSSWDSEYTKFKLDVFIDGDYKRDNFNAIASFKFPEEDAQSDESTIVYRIDTLKLVNEE